MTEDEQPYRVEVDDDCWRVLDSAGNTFITCGDERSAHHYVELLCRAHRTGYKAGYRAGRGVTGP